MNKVFNKHFNFCYCVVNTTIINWTNGSSKIFLRGWFWTKWMASLWIEYSLLHSFHLSNPKICWRHGIFVDFFYFVDQPPNICLLYYKHASKRVLKDLKLKRVIWCVQVHRLLTNVLEGTDCFYLEEAEV